ncbi:hypothetical protein QBC33DRAFT_463074, partial [Phialemonium atrogriseum]
AAFLAEAVALGALDTNDPRDKRQHSIWSNPDRDVNLPNAPYTTFQYLACPSGLANPPVLPDRSKAVVEVDHEGSWKLSSSTGILKPTVIMFSKSIPSSIKNAAKEAIDSVELQLLWHVLVRFEATSPSSLDVSVDSQALRRVLCCSTGHWGLTG